MTASASVVEALIEAVQLVADLSAELKEEIKARYDGMLPQMQSRFDRDMSTVDHAEASLPSLRAALVTPQPAEQDAREAVDYSSLIAARCVALPGKLIDCPVCLAVDNERYRQAAPDGWRPIETAPKDGRNILAWGYLHDDGGPYEADGRSFMGETPHEMVVYFSPEHSVWRDRSHGGSYAGLTHWMPLPPAPPAQGAGG